MMLTAYCNKGLSESGGFAHFSFLIEPSVGLCCGPSVKKTLLTIALQTLPLSSEG